MKSFIIVLSINLISALNLFSQITLSGELRPRFEHRFGYKQLPDTSSIAANFISQRTRINLDFKSKKLETFISIQDSRVWGDEKFKGDNPGIALAEGWAEIIINKKIAIKVGRQSLSYDNKRLITESNWAQSAAFHDALILKYKDSLFEIHAVSALNQSDDNIFGMNYSTLNSNYVSLNILWAKYQLNKFSIATLQVADGYQKTGTENTFYFRYTPGLILGFESKKLNIGARYFSQLGKNKNGTDINAYYTELDVSYKINDKFKLGLGNEYLSGNDFTDKENKTDRTFDVLYGSKHAFNGYMDYYDSSIDTKYAGLDDTFFKFTYSLNKNINFNIDYHYFMLSGKYVKNNEEIASELGSEIDFIINAKLNETSTLQFGYCTMFATESAEILKGGDKSLINRFAYIMLTIKPVFFKEKI